MPDPTENCPNPDAPDFLRCLAAWDLQAAYNIPYVAAYRVVGDDGAVDEDALDRLVKRYWNRPRQRVVKID